MSTMVQTAVTKPLPSSVAKPAASWWRNTLHGVAWLCLLLACCGTSWFSYQYFLVPHPGSFAPPWQDAQWVQAANSNAPVAYFRYDTSLNVLPDGAFVTVAASQIFRLYVNGTFIGSNSLDFTHGDLPRAYMYDVVSPLHVGRNVIALRVSNVDLRIPAVRVNFGVIHGQSTYFHGSGSGWQATVNSSSAHPRYATASVTWTQSNFDDSAWQAVTLARAPANEPTLSVNPLIYEQPIPTQWISAGSGHEAYFMRQFAVPANNGVWLRLVATGTARIFINGNLFMVWNGQTPLQQQTLADYLSNDATVAQYRSGLVLGVYNISPYIHQGINTIAVHVSAPGITAARAGLDNLNAAMALDLLSSDLQNHNTWLSSNNDWHVSYQPVDGWAQGSRAALSWQQPITVGRPGTARTFYLSDSSNARGQQIVPGSLLVPLMLNSSLAVIVLWLCMALFVLKRCFETRRKALEVCTLAFLPALTVEAVLLALSREPQMPRPFPYTLPWALLLLSLIASGFALIALNARLTERRRSQLLALSAMRTVKMPAVRLPVPTAPAKLLHVMARQRVWDWLRQHWGILLLVAITIPLVCSNLSYEPYWQDELTSYYAAKGILAHGLPLLPSGFLYPKGELYSYLLALSIAIFGEQNGAPRMLSIVEYLIGLPLLYSIGCALLNRRIALLATAALALSPMALTWGRQMRMYEQAQLVTMLVFYLFYRVVHPRPGTQERQRIRLIYLAFAALVLDYLSHEETFIVFPAVALWLLYSCGSIYLPFLLVSRHDSDGSVLSHAEKRLLKHWLLAILLTGAAIGVQLLIAHISHPPLLGTDQSQRPLIHFTMDNISYYFYLMFYPDVLGSGSLPWLTMNSLLAVVGVVLAVRRRELVAKYCALFLFVSFLTLMLIFTLTSDRYIYPLLPVYYLLGAYALFTLLEGLWAFIQIRLASAPLSSRNGTEEMDRMCAPVSRPVRIAAKSGMALLLACVLLLPMLPVSNYNLFVSQVAGFSYHRHYADYDAIGSYIQQHWRKGDIVVAVSPAISVLYYVGHVNYFFSVDRALYLFEKDGHIVDTPTGSIALLDQQDFQAVVAMNIRIWIISDNGVYQSQDTKDGRFVFPPDFHLVYEGYGSAIYFRGS